MAPQERPQRGEELVHPPVGEKTVEAAAVARPETPGILALENPPVDVPAGHVHNLLDLGEELLPAAVAQTRRHEGGRFHADASRRAQDPDGVVLGERRRFVLGGETAEACLCAGIDSWKAPTPCGRRAFGA